jgi:lipid-A-disaccharide synthase
MTPFTFALARRLVRVPFIGMPNLIAERRIVPELVQTDATGPRIAAEAERFLDDPAYAAATRAALADVRGRLGRGGAAENAAALAAEMLA